MLPASVRKAETRCGRGEMGLGESTEDQAGHRALKKSLENARKFLFVC